MRRGQEYYNFVNGWSVDFRLEGLRVWDDNTISLPRILDSRTLNAQLAQYVKEEHDSEFWRNGQATTTKYAL